MPVAPDALRGRSTALPPLPDPVGSVAERRERAAEGVARSFGAVKAQYAARRTRPQMIADRLTRVASSTTFLIVHVLWFAVWVLVNSGAVPGHAFDPFPYGLLTLILSVEAIVLTIFVLMSQGRESAVAELREELTLQVNLRMEEEVTKTLQLVTGLYARLGFSVGDDAELRGMLRPLDAREIEQELEQEMDGRENGGPPPRRQRAAESPAETTSEPPTERSEDPPAEQPTGR